MNGYFLLIFYIHVFPGPYAWTGWLGYPQDEIGFCVSAAETQGREI